MVVIHTTTQPSEDCGLFLFTLHFSLPAHCDRHLFPPSSSLMVSSSTLSSLLVQADQVWHPESGDSTRKLKASPSQFSLVDLFCPFSTENHVSAPSHASKTVSGETSRISDSSEPISRPSTKTLLMPNTSVFHRRKCSRPVITGRRPDESELPRTEYPDRERTAPETSAVESSRVEDTRFDSPASPHTWDSRHESFLLRTSSSQTCEGPTTQSHISQNAIHDNNMNNSQSRPSLMYPQGRRSQPIAIKSTPPSSSSFEAFLHSPSSLEDRERREEELTNEQLYDLATWRMYHRIVDHRRTQQQAMAGKPSVSHTTNSYLPPALGSSYSPERHVPSGSTPTFMDELEGEVFEFEI